MRGFKDHLGNEFESVSAMCEYYEIPLSRFYGRLNHGWSLEKALTCKRDRVFDHLGNEYKSYKSLYKSYGISYTFAKEKRDKGVPFEQILNEWNEQKSFSEDHLGNRFETDKAMCDHWGITTNQFRYRLSRGWSIEKALTTVSNIPKRQKTEVKPFIDANGKEFSSFEDMCKEWGTADIDKAWNLYLRGFDILDVLTRNANTVRNGVCFDHEGNAYSGMSTMCSYYNIGYSTYKHRRECGWSLKDSLTFPMVSNLVFDFGSTDHLGNTFDSFVDMCRHYGKRPDVVRSRLRNDWSMRDALTLDVSDKVIPCKDHLGNEFPTIVDMCKHWGIKSGTFNARMKQGNWTLEDALTKKANSVGKKCKDYLGNEFDSIAEMCRYYGINRATFDRRKKRGLSLEEVLKGKKDI